jgi:hypothetical protein
MALIVERFDRADVDVIADLARRADLFGSAEAHAGAILDAAADAVYRAEGDDWISTWRSLNRARFYASAQRWPSVKGLTVRSEASS